MPFPGEAGFCSSMHHPWYSHFGAKHRETYVLQMGVSRESLLQHCPTPDRAKAPIAAYITVPDDFQKGLRQMYQLPVASSQRQSALSSEQSL